MSAPPNPPSGLPALEAMRDEMRVAPEIVRPSAFWEYYAALNDAQLDSAGFDRFKRTINENYFQWRVASRASPAYTAARRRFAARPHPAVAWARLEDDDADWLHDAAAPLPEGDTGDAAPGRPRARLYARYVAMLWEIAGGPQTSLEEPLVGMPLTVRYRGRRISQDLANSLLEARAIFDALPPDALGGGTAIELGGGYGRLSWVLGELIADLRLVLVDIPPALAIAEEYLTRVWPDRRIAPFVHTDDGDALRRRILEAEVAFLTPNQLALLPPLEADLFVNVSSLHEMRPEQVAHFLGEADRHVSGHCYTKQWLRSVNPHDGLEFRREDYRYPAHWRRLYERNAPLTPGFFEALLSTR